MHLLLRIIIGVSFVWLICHFFYSLGRKSALNDQKKNTESNYRRKKVDSSVIEKDSEEDTSNSS